MSRAAPGTTGPPRRLSPSAKSRRGEAPAGTTQMVQCKRTGRPPEVYPWTQPLFHWADRGPVYVVHTPRATTPAAHHAVAGRRTRLYPCAPYSAEPPRAPTVTEATEPRHARQQFTALCRSLNRLNHGLHAHPAPPVDTAVADLLGTDVPSVPEGLRRLALLRQAAGVQAQRSADLVRSLTMTVFGLIGLAALAFHLSTHLFTLVEGHTRHLPFTLWASLVLLLGAFSVVEGAQWRPMARSRSRRPWMPAPWPRPCACKATDWQRVSTTPWPAAISSTCTRN